MRELTINTRSIGYGNKKIEYTVQDAEGGFKFKTPTPHCLTSSSKVILRKTWCETDYNSRMKQHLAVHPTENVYPIEVLDENTFFIKFDDYVLVDVVDYADGNYSALDFVDIDLYTHVWDETSVEISSYGKHYVGSIGLNYDTKTQTFTNEEDFAAKLIFFEKKIKNIKEKDTVYLRNNWHLLDGELSFDNINISIFEYGNFITPTMVGVSESTCYKVGDDTLVGEKFMEEITKSIIPEIIDNEKRQFLPAMAKGKTFKIAQEIEFNLHFRSRVDLDKTTDTNVVLSDTFKTTDVQIWNNFKWKNDEEETSLEYLHGKNYTDDLGDELNNLGFTEDDIKYQKTKLKKTFIRLMFYSSKNMLDKELLYYSTIFLDSGDLYTKYGRIKNSSDTNAFNPERTDKSLRLDASFTVKNKYNTRKSSEGFYLYLFPNEVKGENTSRTIYMKVEFNHAGYGKTIPMMLPRNIYKEDENGNTIIEYNDTNSVLESTSEHFPVSFLVKEQFEGGEGIAMDIERYTDSIMIPVKIIFDNNLKSYLYYFPWYNRANENKIVINLWEPRVRGNINGIS